MVALGASALGNPPVRAHEMVATAYTAGEESTGKGPNHPAYGVTASGTRATEGRTVAVDPDVIPLGTWVYIEGLGLRQAEDTGGAIRGNRLDLFLNDLDAAVEFGVRPVRLWMLGPLL